MTLAKKLINQVEITKGEIIFDMQEFYTHAKDWLSWRGFDAIETKYVETVTPAGKNYEIHWLCEKMIDDYTQHKFDIIWKMLEVKDVEATIGKSKQKLQKGIVNMTLSATIEGDVAAKWNSNFPLFGFLKLFFENYVYKSTRIKLEEELLRVSWEYHSEIKYLLETYKLE
jgi:hypothetical protein